MNISVNESFSSEKKETSTIQLDYTSKVPFGKSPIGLGGHLNNTIRRVDLEENPWHAYDSWEGKLVIGMVFIFPLVVMLFYVCVKLYLCPPLIHRFQRQFRKMKRGGKMAAPGTKRYFYVQQQYRAPIMNPPAPNFLYPDVTIDVSTSWTYRFSSKSAVAMAKELKHQTIMSSSLAQSNVFKNQQIYRAKRRLSGMLPETLQSLSLTAASKSSGQYLTDVDGTPVHRARRAARVLMQGAPFETSSSFTVPVKESGLNENERHRLSAFFPPLIGTALDNL